MTRSSFPEIPEAALRSHAQPERVERVWRRLALDVQGAPRRPRLRLWLLPAAAALFGAGVLVGTRAAAPPAGEVSAVAEPRPPLTVAGAATPPERQTAAEPRPDASAPKVLRRARPRPQSEVLVYPESYAEPRAHEPEPAAGPAPWEQLAEAGDFRAAHAALDRDGGFDVVMARASASQLLVLADIARAGGAREHAAAALRRVLSAYVSAAEAPVAAWTLGNLLEQSGDEAGAAEAYAEYRRLSPAGDFAEDAAARQVDAALTQGNVELAARALDEYAQNFPQGRRLGELRRGLAQLLARDQTPAPDAAGDEEEEQVEPFVEHPAELAPTGAR
jgi:hypothetical protein